MPENKKSPPSKKETKTTKQDTKTDKATDAKTGVQQTDKKKNNNKFTGLMSRWQLVVGILALVLFIQIGVVFLLINQIPIKAKAVQKLHSQNVNSTMSTQDEQLLTQALADTQEDRDKLTQLFPAESSLFEFIKIIDQIKETDVAVSRFTVDSDVPTKIGRSPSFLPMSLALRGKNAEVEAALTQITNSPYFIRVVTFSKEYLPDTDLVVVTTQFHLFVSDAFVEAHP